MTTVDDMDVMIEAVDTRMTDTTADGRAETTIITMVDGECLSPSWNLILSWKDPFPSALPYLLFLL